MATTALDYAGSSEALADVESTVITVLRIYLAIVCVVGSAGNMMTLRAVISVKQLHTLPNIYVANLAITDLVVCLTLIPVTIVTYTEKVPNLFCQLIGYPTITCLMVSVMNLMLIAVNRYVLVCRPYHTYIKWYTTRNVLISITLTWVLALVLYSPPFFGFGKYGKNDLFGTCIFDEQHTTYWFVFVFADCFVMFPALLVTLVCYVRILTTYLRSKKRLGVETSECGQSTNGSFGTVTGKTREVKSVIALEYQSGSNKSRPSRRSLAVTKNLFATWLAYMIFWMPLVLIYKVDYYGQQPAGLYHFLFAFAQSNSAVNFILYGVMNKQFKEAYKAMLTCSKLHQ